jgi:hypothetical protein
MEKFCDNCFNNIPLNSWMIHNLTCKKHNWYCNICRKIICKFNEDDKIVENKHISIEHKKIECECGLKIDKYFLEEHKKECNYKTLICNYCNIDIELKDYSEHLIICGSRTDICNICNKRYKLSELINHNCIINCPFCNEEYNNINNLENHILIYHNE